MRWKNWARHLGLTAFTASGVALIGIPSPARAEIDYPYCMRVYTRDQYVDCSYSTLAQCQMSASGRSALCYRDPFYEGAPGTPYVVKRPRIPYSPFGNIDPNYDPYANAAPAAVPHAPHHGHRKKRHRSKH